MTEKELYDELLDMTQNFCKLIAKPSMRHSELVWQNITNSFTAVALLRLIEMNENDRLPESISDISEQVKEKLKKYFTLNFDLDTILTRTITWAPPTRVLPPLDTEVYCKSSSGDVVRGKLTSVWDEFYSSTTFRWVSAEDYEPIDSVTEWAMIPKSNETSYFSRS